MYIAHVLGRNALRNQKKTFDYSALRQNYSINVRALYSSTLNMRLMKTNSSYVKTFISHAFQVSDLNC